MFRTGIFLILAVASVGMATAGQIQIGGTNGLTSSNVTGAGTLANYANLFSGATNSGTPPLISSSPDYKANAGNGTLTDSAADGGAGVTFSLISQTGAPADNFWLETQPSPFSNPTITIPVGVYGVEDVWTMINTELAMAGLRNIALQFNFGATPTATTVSTVIVKLTGSGASSIASGQSQNAVDCTPASSCPTLASGPTLASTLVSGVTVDTDTLFSSSYNNGPLASYSTPGGNVTLDDQGFIFNDLALTGLFAGATNLNTYLVSVGVQDIGVSGVAVGLSAITIDAVPEPSTILLLLTGFSALSFARLRRG